MIPTPRTGISGALKRVLATRRLSTARVRGKPPHTVPRAVAGVDSPGPLGQKKHQFLAKWSARDLTCLFLVTCASYHPAPIRVCAALLPLTPAWVVKQLIYPIYCGGETCTEVVATARKLAARGFGNVMISYAVEDCDGTGTSRGPAVDDEIKKSIVDILAPHHKWTEQQALALHVRPTPGSVALKPTGLTSTAAATLAHYKDPAYKQRWEHLLDVCRGICATAQSTNGRVEVVFDAEKYALQQGVYALQRQMMKEFNTQPADKPPLVYGTIQMYLANALDTLEHEMQLAQKGKYALGLKLVRGAYIHSEPNRAVIHATKKDADHAYNTGVRVCIDSIVQGGPVGKLIVASHNAASMALVDAQLGENNKLKQRDRVVFAQLMGMSEDEGTGLSARGHSVVKYTPWGAANETKAYLVRRIQENGDALNTRDWPLIRAIAAELWRRCRRPV